MPNPTILPEDLKFDGLCGERLLIEFKAHDFSGHNDQMDAYASWVGLDWAAALKDELEKEKPHVPPWITKPEVERNRSSNRPPRLQVKAKNRQKIKLQKAARKHNRKV